MIFNFGIPFFVDKVDLEKLHSFNNNFESYWPSQTPTTFHLNNEVPKPVTDYIVDKLMANIGHINPTLIPYSIHIWRNKYTEKDYQDVHIHPQSHWSFIIYETVSKSRTVFCNPAKNLILNQFDCYDQVCPEELKPELEHGDMIIFPSFVEHYVERGGSGITISGNLRMIEND
jgi:hypothetical protein